MGRRGWFGLVLVCIAALPARADHEETERRLKAVGVDPELRARIHTAIDRAVGYLVERQRERGSWTQRPLMAGIIEAQTVSGFTSLAALACAHADTPAGVEASDRALGYLLPGDDRIRTGVYKHVYTAGLTAMLLQAKNRNADVGQEIARRLARGQRRSGWWGYVTFGPPIPEMNPVGANLSTSQFAALGLWACERMNADVDRDVWRKHLVSLCSRQLEDGSWTYWPGRGNARGYRTGTYMGLANLVLARAALGDSLEDESELKFRADRALEKALEALDRDGVETLKDVRRENEHGWAGLYELYALEKACIFAEREKVGDRAWYAEAAEVLVDAQGADGGWGAATQAGRRAIPGTTRTDLYRTAFGLLFLLRTSEVYRPVTPSGVRRGVRTPGAGDAPPTASTRKALSEEAAEREAPADPTPFGTATGLLDELQRQLAAKRTPEEALLATLDEAAVAYVTLAPGPIPPDADGNAMMAAEEAFLKGEAAWRLRAEALFVAALVTRDVDRRNEFNRRNAVNVRAARVLRRVHRRVAEPARKAIDKHLLDPRGHIVTPELYAEAFATLGHLGEPESLTWFVEDVVSAEHGPEPVKRTLAALDAIPLFRDVPGKRRFEAATRLVKLFNGVENHRLPDDYNAIRQKEYWDRMGPAVIEALRALCRDAKTGAKPVNALGFQVGTVRDFETYLRAHEDLKKPPWR